jgi:hypothetical protein
MKQSSPARRRLVVAIHDEPLQICSVARDPEHQQILVERLAFTLVTAIAASEIREFLRSAGCSTAARKVDFDNSATSYLPSSIRPWKIDDVDQAAAIG